MIIYYIYNCLLLSVRSFKGYMNSNVIFETPVLALIKAGYN